eukprot:2544034-Prymnesium_polylepis.2
MSPARRAPFLHAACSMRSANRDGHGRLIAVELHGAVRRVATRQRILQVGAPHAAAARLAVHVAARRRAIPAHD